MSTASLEQNELLMYVCPACKGRLEIAGRGLCCSACNLVYPLLDGIPDFMLEDPERRRGLVARALVGVLARLYETPLWYPRFLKSAGGDGAPSFAQLMQHMLSLMDVREGTLLDVACGPGTWGRRLASPSMEAYGIDMTWSMLRQGMRVVRSRGIAHMHFAHARVEALPFGERRFDAAYCGGALWSTTWGTGLSEPSGLRG